MTRLSLSERMRALNIAEQTEEIWNVANNGAGKLAWFVMRKHSNGDAEYHYSADGRLVRYTLAGALTCAERLNATE